MSKQLIVDIEELPSVKPNETVIPLSSLDDLVRIADDLHVSAKDMCATISRWAEQRNKQGDLAMGHFPSVIAAEGCVS